MITRLLLASYSKLQIRGHNPEEVEREVNRLQNFGVITTVPDTFRAGVDQNVICNTYKKRLHSGLAAIAESSLLSIPGYREDIKEKNRGCHREVWADKVEMIAEDIFEREFDVESNDA